MDPLRRVLIGACALATIATLAAPPAHAQFYADVQRSLDLAPDPIARSPRMVGMGRLTLVVDDIHHRFDIWEFSRNPAGLLDSDSTSTLELYPATVANSTVHDQAGADGTREEQDFALRQFRTGYETWRRTPHGEAFGIIGEFDQLRIDAPLTASTESRRQFSVPINSLVISGPMPMVRSDRVRYGVSFTYRYESQTSQKRADVSNAAGDYIDKDGFTIPPSGDITPDQNGIGSLGSRLGVVFRATKDISLGGSYDYSNNNIDGTNDEPRDASEITETRPYSTWAANAAGRIGGSFRFVGDVSRWTTPRTDERWFASLSTGTGQLPVQGRGLYQRRDENGHEYRGRASWTERLLTLSIGGSDFRRDVSTLVPPVDDRTSFNYFLNSLSGRQGADSLSLPDSIVSNQSVEKGHEYGAGASYQLPWRATLVAAEYHQSRSTLDQEVGGPGPDRRTWDVRTGAEVPVNAIVSLRGGYIHQWLDRDHNTANNEYLTDAVTGGLSLSPLHATWGMELAYEVAWQRADFGDPTRIRTSTQSGLFRLRWVF